MWRRGKLICFVIKGASGKWEVSGSHNGLFPEMRRRDHLNLGPGGADRRLTVTGPLLNPEQTTKTCHFAAQNIVLLSVHIATFSVGIAVFSRVSNILVGPRTHASWHKGQQWSLFCLLICLRQPILGPNYCFTQKEP